MLVCIFNSKKPCGKCQPCRILAQVNLIKRLQIQWQLMPFAYFITCTYDNENLPIGPNGLPTLVRSHPKDMRNHMKLLLPKHVSFWVGEYGGKFFGSKDAERDINPHYHGVIFFEKEARDDLKRVVQHLWGRGRTQVLNCSQSLITYISGYVTKKLTNVRSMDSYLGLCIRPEFSLYPRKPGLGDISEEYLQTWETFGLVDEIILNNKKVALPSALLKKCKEKFSKTFGKEELRYEFYQIRQEKIEKEILQIMQSQKKSRSQAIAFLNGPVIRQKKVNSQRKVSLRYGKNEKI